MMKDFKPSVSALQISGSVKGSSPSTLRFPIVGLGASAGGIPALIRFFKNMSSDSGMAFVVILHLSPTHESSVAEILQNATSMRVRQVTEQMAIKSNCVYVIPPNKQLLMDDSHLGIADLTPPSTGHASIDVFFRALADVHMTRAIGVVLSGTGTDGTIGLGRIKEQGGITFAQDPSDAEQGGMPRSAIDAGMVDVVLPAREMPAALLKLWENAKSLTLPPVENPDEPIIFPVPTTPHQALREILALLFKATGHDFRRYKRGTVMRRIERRMQICTVPDLPAYRDYMKANPTEITALLRDLLISVTSFFRGRGAFEAIEKEVIPRLFAAKKGRDLVRVWVPACATGEEAYSLAMLLAEESNRLPGFPDFQVFATDIDEHAIAVARAGLYPQAIETDVTPERLHRFFTEEDKRYLVKKNLRDKLLFAPHDVLTDSPFSRLDLISCRNLLIYLNHDVHDHLFELFHFSLNPGGFLFLGDAEVADAEEFFFKPFDKEARLYQAVLRPPGQKHAPSLPAAHPVWHPFLHQQEKTPDQPKPSSAQIFQYALTQIAPPSVIVDHNSDIVYLSDKAGRYLCHVGGEPSRNLPSLVLPQLALELRSTLYQTIQLHETVESSRVRIERGDDIYYVTMTMHPFHYRRANANFVLVVFNEAKETAPMGAVVATEGIRDKILASLEEELRQTKDQLRKTLEHAEVSAEEYRSSVEELQAINEELRSATEELETSKEELQSTNEELVTVNYEMRMKVEEATKVNDDLNNLIASTDIAAIFVDPGMCIKRYTPAAAKIFNIIANDLDRSLLDITHRLDYPALADDAASTFKSLIPVEREISGKDGNYYIARILPYRTTGDRIGGAVLTFINITSRHQAEARSKASERRVPRSPFESM